MSDSIAHQVSIHWQTGEDQTAQPLLDMQPGELHRQVQYEGDGVQLSSGMRY